MRTAKAQAIMRIRAGSPEPSLFAHTIQGSRESFRQKAVDSFVKEHKLHNSKVPFPKSGLTYHDKNSQMEGQIHAYGHPFFCLLKSHFDLWHVEYNISKYSFCDIFQKHVFFSFFAYRHSIKH